jgi:hypothetical protein
VHPPQQPFQVELPQIAPDGHLRDLEQLAQVGNVLAAVLLHDLDDHPAAVGLHRVP